MELVGSLVSLVSVSHPDDPVCVLSRPFLSMTSVHIFMRACRTVHPLTHPCVPRAQLLLVEPSLSPFPFPATFKLTAPLMELHLPAVAHTLHPSNPLCKLPYAECCMPVPGSACYFAADPCTPTTMSFAASHVILGACLTCCSLPHTGHMCPHTTGGYAAVPETAIYHAGAGDAGAAAAGVFGPGF